MSLRHYVMPDSYFWIHVCLGEKDQAFEWLQKMFDEQSGGMVWLKVDPMCNPIRSDPRFNEWLRRLKFKP